LGRRSVTDENIWGTGHVFFYVADEGGNAISVGGDALDIHGSSLLASGSRGDIGAWQLHLESAVCDEMGKTSFRPCSNNPLPRARGLSYTQWTIFWRSISCSCDFVYVYFGVAHFICYSKKLRNYLSACLSTTLVRGMLDKLEALLVLFHHGGSYLPLLSETILMA